MSNRTCYSVDINIYEEMCLYYGRKYNKPEEWRPLIINGVTTRYTISNYGRIRNINKNESPTIRCNNNHFVVNIVTDIGKYKQIGTYRLVAMTFIDVPQKYIDMGYSMDTLVVDHLRDGDKDNFNDNTMWNLQWLTHRENTAKAAKCGYREAFEIGFRDELDQMILDGYDNKSIYEFCKNVYGYLKPEIKATLQVRRRRLGKTLKEHHERDRDFVKYIDSLLIQGMSNEEIIQKALFTESKKSARRLLQYRRSILNIPAQTSKYLSNDDNKKMAELIMAGKSNKEIIDALNLNLLDDITIKKLNATISSRRIHYRNAGKLNISSTTRERVSNDRNILERTE